MTRQRKYEPGPNPYPTLFIKYGLIFVYAVTSGVVGVTTLDVVAGEWWALLWPTLMALFSLLAFLGVLRSKRTGRYLFEIVATLLLIAMFAGYVVAIVYRGFDAGEYQRLPVAWLPVILSVFPTSRLVDIAPKRWR